LFPGPFFTTQETFKLDIDNDDDDVNDPVDSESEGISQLWQGRTNMQGPGDKNGMLLITSMIHGTN